MSDEATTSTNRTAGIGMDNTELLQEILHVLRSIDKHGANFEADMKAMRFDMNSALAAIVKKPPADVAGGVLSSPGGVLSSPGGVLSSPGNADKAKRSLRSKPMGDSLSIEQLESPSREGASGSNVTLTPHKDSDDSDCQAASNGCQHSQSSIASAINEEDISGLESSVKSLSLDGGGDTDSDNNLAKELRRIEDEYLKKELTDVQKAIPRLVNHLKETLITSTLQEHLSDLAFMGSAYEYTTVPGKSDFDIQFFVKLPFTRENHQKIFSAVAEECADPAWKKVKGGPEKLQENGYLSSTKVRTMLKSEIDKALQTLGSSIEFEGGKAVIKRSASGPATTLNVSWKGESISMDIVTCLKAEDVGNSGGHDLVGKPYDKRDSQPGHWRLSYSKKELAKLRELHKLSPRKLTLMRIMKVIRQTHSQLRPLPSYFYKNILFMLDRQKPATEEWNRANFAQRFKDMIALICEALDTQTLRLHFNPDVNYLATYDKFKITQIANYLKAIIKKGKYMELLNQVPPRK